MTQVGEARRYAAKLTRDNGFGEVESGNVAIIVSELATNLTRYSDDGELLLHARSNRDGRWMDILAIDGGPGISDIPRCLTDGYSTGGTPGNGLGAVRRLSTEFDLFSTAPGGTVIFSRVASPQKHQSQTTFQWGCISRPAPLETFCGDAWSIAEQDGKLSILVVDGLGHGPLAASAADEATGAFYQGPFAPLEELLQRADVRMRGTRGGAVAAAHIDSAERTLRYLGIGNISGSLRVADGERGRGLISHNGTVGAQVRQTKVFDHEITPRGLLIMHSDGLQTRWSLETYRGLAQRHPGVIAGVLYRDFTRGRDDVTVAVVRFPAE